MNTSTAQQPRQESDRQGQKKWYSSITARPEIGPLGVLLLLFCMLGYISIPPNISLKRLLDILRCETINFL